MSKRAVTDALAEALADLDRIRQSLIGDESAGPGLRRKSVWEQGEGIQRREPGGDFPIARRDLSQCNEFSRVIKVIHT